jgi:tetratricopeptide (TPR) repeat protein
MRSHEPSTSLPAILSSFGDIAALSLPRQLHMVFRLHSHLKKVKVGQEALEMLFRLILSKASLIPVAVLLAIGDFYAALGKLDKALELYDLALKKVETKEIPMKYAIIYLIADIHFRNKRFPIALKHFLYTQAGREKILGYEHLDTLAAISSIGVCHFELANY